MTKSRHFYVVFLSLFFCLVCPDMLGQQSRQLCTQAIADRVSTNRGQAPAIVLSNTQTYPVSTSEEGLRGRASIRTAGQPETRADFDCRVNTRFGYVTRLDLGEGTKGSGGGWWDRQEGGNIGRSQCSVPTLYSDDGYRGRTFPVNQSVRDLHDQGFGDEASSICVPYGWRVVLYSDDGFRGERLEVNGPQEIDDLKRQRPQGEDWGDRVSSVEVLRVRAEAGVPDECSRIPMLYSDDDFKGSSLRLDKSSSDLHRQGFGDRASSACVPAGWVLEIFEDTGYGGSQLRLNGPIVISDLKRDRPDGQDWGDRISSVRVSRSRFR